MRVRFTSLGGRAMIAHVIGADRRAGVGMWDRVLGKFSAA